MNMFKFLSTDGTSVYYIDIQQYSRDVGQIMHNNKRVVKVLWRVTINGLG